MASFSIFAANDGFVQYNKDAGDTFSFIHDQTSGTNAINNPDEDTATRISTTGTTDNYKTIARGGFNFNTSSIGSGQQIDTAVLSLFEDQGNSIDAFSDSVNIVAFNPSDPNSFATTDYNSSLWGTSAYATKTLAAIVAASNSYQNFSLNSAGKLRINVTSNTVFGARGTFDMNNTPPTWASTTTARFLIYFSGHTGTSNDPVLTGTNSSTVTFKPAGAFLFNLI